MDELKKVTKKKSGLLQMEFKQKYTCSTNWKEFYFSLPSMRKVYNSNVQKIVIFENSIL